MQTYRRYLYHFVWATKERQPLIIAHVESHLHEYIRLKCEELRVYVYAVNGMSDHVHLACSLPTSLSVAAFIKTIKGGSAHFINHLPRSQPGLRPILYWQPGFGGLTLTARDLPRLTHYIDGQKQHHADGSTLSTLEWLPPVPQGLSFLEE
jgi:putative transposase